ncbi:MAG: OmpA family protein [Alphaproteobacteria bacterium]
MTRSSPQTALARRIAGAMILAAVLLLAAGCTEYDVPGGDRPWPKLGDFPDRPDDDSITESRQRLLDRYGDPEESLPEPALVPLRPPKNALRVAVIYFPRGEQSLDPAGLEILSQVAAYAQQSRSTVWLFGYASVNIELVVGVTAKAQRNLSGYRVRMAALALSKNGVPLQRLKMIARGAADPAYLETKPAGEAGNRRVEIYFTPGD